MQNNIEVIIRKLANLFPKPDPNAEPAPRWQTLTLSFAIGMLMYFMAARLGMLG